jgi:putative flippase GtrA
VTSAVSALGTRRRLPRYAVVSVLSAGLAQVGLVLGYGLAHWGVAAAVLLSLAVSAPASYVLNRLYVWRRDDRPVESPAREFLAFVALAVLGTVLAMAIIAGAEHVARSITRQHVVLTAVVDVAGLLSMVGVWFGRYFLLDRFVFRSASVSSSDVGRRHQVMS